MRIDDTIEGLRQEANSNPASNAVFHVFALRKRARNTITVNSLYHKMQREGFKYSKSDYTATIKTLASLGFGSLDTDSKGRIRGLKGVTTTLQSIGAAACGQNKRLEKYTEKNKFEDLPVDRVEVPKAKPKAVYELNLEISVNGKSVHIPVPKELNSEEVALLIGRLKTA